MGNTAQTKKAPRSKNRPVPPETQIVIIDGRHYPMRVEKDATNAPVCLRAYVKDGRVISYARKGEALDYLLRSQQCERAASLQ